ncbi:MAG: phage recombination protein Bet [Anaerostipes hadrus]|nr:phage recombination protein Bet [Anaerostipes hadrus]
MAVGNSLAKKRTDMYQNAQVATYEVAGHKIELTPEIIKNYMISGNKERVTMEEVIMFMNLCKHSGLNPWVKEAYCIKYGNEPATMVVGKEAYMKRAEQNEFYDGFEAGIIVVDSRDGEVIHRSGSFRLPTEEVIGGWAKVWRKDKAHAYEAEVAFDEYAGRKKDGTLNSQWKSRPATMIRKVALVQALREAFPSTFGGMYIAEESGYAEPENGQQYFVTKEDEKIPIMQQEDLPESTVPKEEPQPIPTETEKEEPQQFFK